MSWLSKWAGGGFDSAAKNYKNAGREQYDYGREILESALGGLGDLDTRYTDILREGGLPADVRAGYRVQQGRISDETSRATKAFGAELSQRAKASGGRLDPNAAIASQIEYDAKTNDVAFNARNSIAFEEANRSLANTNAILEALERIRGMKLGAGVDFTKMSSDMWGDAIRILLDRRKAIASTAASAYGSSQSGG